MSIIASNGYEQVFVNCKNVSQFQDNSESNLLIDGLLVSMTKNPAECLPLEGTQETFAQWMHNESINKARS